MWYENGTCFFVPKNWPDFVYTRSNKHETKAHDIGVTIASKKEKAQKWQLAGGYFVQRLWTFVLGVTAPYYPDFKLHYDCFSGDRKRHKMM